MNSLKILASHLPLFFVPLFFFYMGHYCLTEGYDLSLVRGQRIADRALFMGIVWTMCSAVSGWAIISITWKELRP